MGDSPIAAAEETERVLQFEPFSSCIDSTFWNDLTRNKLNHYGLDESAKQVQGSYSIGNAPGLPCIMTVDGASLQKLTKSSSVNTFEMNGHVVVYNTIENFKNADKQKIASEEAVKLWSLITSQEALQKPLLLSSFLILCFMDLKKYVYHYWCLFPAVVYPDAHVHKTAPRKIGDVFSESEIASIATFVDGLSREQNAFLISSSAGNPFQLHQMSSLLELVKKGNKVTLCVCDPSVHEDSPGWPVRNMIALFAYHVRSLPTYHRVDVLCFRQRFREGQRDLSHSLVCDVRLVFTPEQASEKPNAPKGVGWERNAERKLAPRKVDLSGQLDPHKIAEQAVGLNLQLMRWRLVPNLDLGLFARAKCLLLGSGTLGCNVARCLMGWGVQKITFVDNGKVSYSNPVRQSLFAFEDCLNGGKAKAEAAADQMRRIYPSIDATGHQLTIPMPGHSVSSATKGSVVATLAKLEQLIDEHDVVFLLMDTRESRWLPTVVSAARKKIVVNAALGFDSYLVMRHGLDSGSCDGRKLGCYFCNDVVAPGNSTRDRTLDQQCTVTRPGVSMMAAAHAVELMASLLQHPEQASAPACHTERDGTVAGDASSPLGLVPHQIRCFLSRQSTIFPVTTAFDRCTACSSTVIQQYQEKGHDFLLEVFNNDASFLENLTGLSKLHEDSSKLEIWDLSDDDSGSND